MSGSYTKNNSGSRRQLAAAVSKWAAETWAQLLAQQYSLIIPRGSTAVIFLLSHDGKEAWGWRWCSGAAVLSVSAGLAVEQIVPVPPRKKSTSWLQLQRGWTEVVSSGYFPSSSTLVCVFSRSERTNPQSSKGWAGKGNEGDRANKRRGWRERIDGTAGQTLVYSRPGLRMRVQNRGRDGQWVRESAGGCSYLGSEKSSGLQWWWMCCRPRHRFQSQLPGQMEQFRGRQTGREKEGVTLPLSISTVMPATVPHSMLLLFINYPRSSLAAGSPPYNPALSLSLQRTLGEQPFGKWSRKREGRKRWDLGEHRRGKAA